MPEDLSHNRAALALQAVQDTRRQTLQSVQHNLSLMSADQFKQWLANELAVLDQSRPQ